MTTKTHVTCDALDNPTDIILTAGQARDFKSADALLPAVTADKVIADEAFDADERVT